MTLEICVDDIAGLDAAIAGGADRIELCAALALGGLTPAPSLIAAARTAPIPVHMLVRPREGGFHYSARETAMIAADITAAAEAGLAGVVIGATCADHALDVDTLAHLITHARALTPAAFTDARKAPLSLTLHRAIDLCADMPSALDTAIALGFDRVLTSGGEPRAIDGVAMIETLHRRAAGRIGILAGSGIDADNVARILATGIGEIHASCGSAAAETDTAEQDHERRFGFAAPERRHTDAARVRRLKAALVGTLAKRADQRT